MSEFIESIESVNTGGGTMVDFIYLKNGQIITVNEGFAILHDDEESFWDEDKRDCPALNLNQYGWTE